MSSVWFSCTEVSETPCGPIQTNKRQNTTEKQQQKQQAKNNKNNLTFSYYYLSNTLGMFPFLRNNTLNLWEIK